MRSAAKIGSDSLAPQHSGTKCTKQVALRAECSPVLHRLLGPCAAQAPALTVRTVFVKAKPAAMMPQMKQPAAITCALHREGRARRCVDKCCAAPGPGLACFRPSPFPLGPHLLR